MKKILSLSLLLSTGAYANLHLAPPDFEAKGGRAVFVDFKTADYEIIYDLEHEKAVVKSRITFEAKNPGRPVFDLVPWPMKIKINGSGTTAAETKDPNGSPIRVLNKSVESGVHVLEMENNLTRNTNFQPGRFNVSSSFWIRDLKERMFMEQYLPSNFEYDQYKMTFHVKFLGTKKVKQDFFTNGKLTQTSKTSWKIEFPEHYTVSCPYFHLTPANSKRRIDFNYKSVDGRDIPITVYTEWYLKTSSFAEETKRVMAELEADYGPWGHPSFVAYGTLPGGGMEHAGATQTSFGALDHEMLHSYFAKGVMPANGNSGWIDEAIASWRDYGYQRLPHPGFSGSNIGAHSPYQRNTDDRSYVLGRGFMGHMDYLLQDMGGLKAFLRGYFKAYNKSVVTTEHFKNNLEFFSGLNLDAEFETYIWGENSADSKKSFAPNPKHAPLTEAQIRSLL